MIIRASAARAAHSRLRAAAGALAAAVGLAALPRAVEADHLVTRTATHPNVKVLSLEKGRLLYRGADGTSGNVWLGDINLLIVDREGAFADFNQAERFLSTNEPTQAIGRYRRAQRLRDDFWVDLISARVLLAAERAGQAGDAVQEFIRLLKSPFIGPEGAARLFPTDLPNRVTAETTRAVELLQSELTSNAGDEHRALATIFRYEVQRRASDPRVSDSAATAAVLTIAPSIATDRTFEIQLAAMTEAMRGKAPDGMGMSVDRAIRDCSEQLLPSFLLLKGRMLAKSAESRTDLIRAAWPFMRVAVHMPKDPRAAEALFDAAVVMERLGRQSKAIELLGECRNHEKVSESVRQAADAALTRLQSSAAKKP